MAFDNPFKGLSKPQLYATMAGSAGLGGYLLYRHHSSTGSWNPFSSGSGSSTSGTTSSTQTDPVTGLPYSQDDATDPVTGLTYLAEAQQYGSVAAAEADVSQYGQSSDSGSGVGVSPATYPESTAATGAVTGSTYTSNSAWAQAAQAGLTDIGYSGTDVATALGDYLTGTPVTAAQAQIIQAAIAEYGPPPVGTFQVILKPAAGTGTTSGTGTTATPGAVTGFSVTPHPGYADFGWKAVTSADNYNLVITGPQAVDRQTGNVLHAEHVTLKPGKYSAQIRANNHGKYGPWSARKAFIVPPVREVTGGNPPRT